MVGKTATMPSPAGANGNTAYQNCNYTKDDVKSAMAETQELWWQHAPSRFIPVSVSRGSRHLSGFRSAPPTIPFSYQLQTLLLTFHSLCITLFILIFLYLTTKPLLWPLLILYVIYAYTSKISTSGTLGLRSNFFRSLRLWSFLTTYFPATLYRSQRLSASRKYIFGYHPHGIIAHGAFAAFNTEALAFSLLFPGITNTLLTLESNFRIPIYREYALALGLASVSRQSCINILSRGGHDGSGAGRAITIVTGGANESLEASPHTLRLVLQNRMGFVKLAIRTGADLVPVLAFGENELYDTVNTCNYPWIHKLQQWQRDNLGWTVPLFYTRGKARYLWSLLPYRKPLNVVVGKPIEVVQDKEPGVEVVERMYGLYVRELQNLWDAWKDEFAREREGELEIV